MKTKQARIDDHPRNHLNENQISGSTLTFILATWEAAKKSVSKQNTISEIKILAKILRSYIVQVRTKTGIPPQYSETGQKMVVYLEKRIFGFRPSDENETSQLLSAIAACQYARKNLRFSAVHGTAIKGKLTASDRKSLERIARAAIPKRPEDPFDGDEL